MDDVTVGPWKLVGTEGRLSLWSDEGVATFAGRQVYRGGGSVPGDVRGAWPHIGDPDATSQVLVDCFQGPAGATAKMFRATGVSGGHADHRHELAAHEVMNNSFVAIAPGGQWMVSGEWYEIDRLLVFPVPSPDAGGDLPLSALLHLDHPMRNVQGAAWVDPLTLLCSTDDPDTDLWPVARQLLQVTLDEPLAGTPTTGKVTCLGALPLQSHCSGTFEVEGMDYDASTGDLRVIVIPPAPCKWLWVTVYRFRQA